MQHSATATMRNIPIIDVIANTFLFEVFTVDMFTINENMVGIVTTLDGLPIEEGSIAGKDVPGHNNFQDADAFFA